MAFSTVSQFSPLTLAIFEVLFSCVGSIIHFRFVSLTIRERWMKLQVELEATCQVVNSTDVFRLWADNWVVGSGSAADPSEASSGCEAW